MYLEMLGFISMATPPLCPCFAECWNTVKPVHVIFAEVFISDNITKQNFCSMFLTSFSPNLSLTAWIFHAAILKSLKSRCTFNEKTRII